MSDDEKTVAYVLAAALLEMKKRPDLLAGFIAEKLVEQSAITLAYIGDVDELGDLVLDGNFDIMKLAEDILTELTEAAEGRLHQ